MRRLVLVCCSLLIFLAACAVRPVPAAKMADVKTISIVSALGDDLVFKYVGFTILTNSEQLSSVGWKLDDYMTSELTATLSDRYEIRSFNHDKTKLVKQGEQNIFGGWPSSRDLLKSMVKPGEVDAYVVIRTGDWGDAIGHTNQEIHGIGLYGRGGLFGKVQIVAPFTAYAIEIIDGRTFDTIGAAPGVLPRRADVGIPLSNLGLPIDTLPFRDSNVPWASKYELMPPPQQQLFHEAILSLLDESLRYTLQKMALTQAQPK